MLALAVPHVALGADTSGGMARHGDPQVPALWKLGRGFQNAFLGFPAEVSKNTLVEAFKSDSAFGFGSGAFEGLFVGIGKGFWRVGAGVCDIFTFPAADFAPWYTDDLEPYPF